MSLKGTEKCAVFFLTPFDLMRNWGSVGLAAETSLRLMVRWLLRTVAAPQQRSGWPRQPAGAPVRLIPHQVWSQNVDRPAPLGMFVLDERQPRAEMISCATHSCVPFFNKCFYQGLICGIAALVAWEPASLLARRFLLWLHGGEGTAGDN